MHAQQVSVDSFRLAVSAPGTQVLDVRTSTEYATGFLPGTLQADWNNQAEFNSRTKALDKSRPVYVYCLSGVRSAAAMKRLQEQGYTAIALAGGLNSWKKQGLPLANQVAVAQMSDAAYQRLVNSANTVIVDFGATWCPPCRVMAPRLDSLADVNPSFKLVKIDGGEQTELSKKLDVNGFPTLLVYKDGKLTWRNEGLIDAAEIRKHL